MYIVARRHNLRSSNISVKLSLNINVKLFEVQPLRYVALFNKLFQAKMVGMFYSLAYVCILISSKTLSQPATWEWYDILARAQEHACIPEHSECYKGFGLPIPRQSSTPLPRQTNHSLPANNGVKHPRGLDVVNPLNMKRYPRICCGFCSCDSYCRKHGSCCLSSYESLAHGRILTKNSR